MTTQSRDGGRRFEDRVTRFRRSVLWLALTFFGFAALVSVLVLCDVWRIVNGY